VNQYRYAIGTSPGVRNVVGWTYLAGASFVRNDLNLLQGQPYYVSVQAHNTSGLWSANGVSNAVNGGEAPTPGVIAPDSGGTVTGPVGDLDASLTIPPGALDEAVTLDMHAVAETPPTGGLAVLGQSFRIEARTLAGAPVTQFAAPLTLVVHYDDERVAGIDENALQIFYWDEGRGAWVAIPTTVDAAANTLTAQLDHLTLFAVLYKPAAEQKLYLPRINR
jgi:hypothetical protein